MELCSTFDIHHANAIELYVYQLETAQIGQIATQINYKPKRFKPLVVLDNVLNSAPLLISIYRQRKKKKKNNVWVCVRVYTEAGDKFHIHEMMIVIGKKPK